MLPGGLKNVSEKAKNALKGAIPASQNTLESNIPTIRNVLLEKIPPTVIENTVQYIDDDEKVKQVFGSVYMLLPSFIKIIVKQDAFVQFCLEKKKILLADSMKKPGSEQDQSVLYAGS